MVLRASSALKLLDGLPPVGSVAPQRWADEVGLALGALPGLSYAHVLRFDAADLSLQPIGDRHALDVVQPGHDALSRPRRRTLYGAATVRTAREELPRLPSALATRLADFDADDVLGVITPLADGTGDALAISGLLQPTRRAFTEHERALWGTLSEQLAAAFRVTRALSELPLGLERLEAEHDAGLRAGLAEMLRELDRRRARAVRVVGDEAASEVLDLWTRILTGGWSVAELEADGRRRRVIAIRNRRSGSRSLRRLTAEELEVVSLAAEGLSDQAISDELGQPEGTVATRLARARQRLGLRSRVELVRLARTLGAVK